MKRLKYPWLIPYDASAQIIAHFNASKSEVAALGDPVYVERDPYRCAGPEWYWGFEGEDGFRMVICWHELPCEAPVLSDPPDPERAVAALRELGIGVEVTRRPLPADQFLKRYHARFGVWLFTAPGADRPAAAFSRKQLADEWIRKERATGTLTGYPLDLSVAEASRRDTTGLKAEPYNYRDGLPEE